MPDAIMVIIALIGAPTIALPTLDEKNARHLAAMTEPKSDNEPAAAAALDARLGPSAHQEAPGSALLPATDIPGASDGLDFSERRAWERVDADEAAARRAWMAANCSSFSDVAVCDNAPLWSVAVISRGGSGSSTLLHELGRVLPTHHEVLMNTSDPLTFLTHPARRCRHLNYGDFERKCLKAQDVRRAIYVFDDPAAEVASLFRRGWAAAMAAVDIAEDPIGALRSVLGGASAWTSVESYAKHGKDLIGLEAHFRSWRAARAPFPVLFLRMGALSEPARIAELARYLAVGADDLAELGHCTRFCTEGRAVDALKPSARSALDTMYGNLSAIQSEVPGGFDVVVPQQAQPTDTIGGAGRQSGSQLAAKYGSQSSTQTSVLDSCAASDEARAVALNDTVKALLAEGWSVVRRGELRKLDIYASGVGGFLAKVTGANPNGNYGAYFFGAKAWVTRLLGNNVPGWTIGAKDVLISVTCTPEARYLSYGSYLVSQPTHPAIMASLGDPVNHLVLNTTAASDPLPRLDCTVPASAPATTGQNGMPAPPRTAAIVTTGDASTYARVSAALCDARLPASLSAIPLPILGSLEASLFMTLHRANGFESDAARSTYWSRRQPVVHLAPPRSQAASPLPLQPLRRPGTGRREGDAPELLSALESLRDALVARHGEPVGEASCEPFAVELRRQRINDFGFFGIGGFGTEDATYAGCAAAGLDSLPAEHAIVMVYGTNCAKTNMCTVAMLGARSCGVGSALHSDPTAHMADLGDDRVWAGSAAQYVPGLAQADHLFAVSVALSCDSSAGGGLEPFCTSVPLEHLASTNAGCVADAVSPKIGINSKLRLTYGAFLQPETGTRPLAAEMVMPRVAVFDRRRQGTPARV